MARRLLRADEYQRSDDIARRIARRHRKQIADAVDRALIDFQDQTKEQDDNAIADAILAGGAAGLLAAIGWGDLRNDIGSSLRSLDGVFREAAADAAAEQHVQPAAAGVEAIALPDASDSGVFYAGLDRYRESLVDEIVQSSEDGIAAAIERARAAGIDVGTVGRAVRSTIGLTDRQAFAVFNYRRALEEGDSSLARDSAWALRDHRFDATAARAARGEPVDQDLIDRMVDAYARRQLDYRARMIADTESTKIANAAIRSNWQQAISNGVVTQDQLKRHWRVAIDEKTCPICYSVPILNPGGVGFDEPFLSIMGPVWDVGLHPWCRCSIFYDVVSVLTAALEAV